MSLNRDLVEFYILYKLSQKGCPTEHLRLGGRSRDRSGDRSRSGDRDSDRSGDRDSDRSGDRDSDRSGDRDSDQVQRDTQVDLDSTDASLDSHFNGSVNGPAPDSAPSLRLGPAQDSAPSLRLGPAQDSTPSLRLGPAQDSTPSLRLGPAQDSAPSPRLGPATDSAPSPRLGPAADSATDSAPSPRLRPGSAPAPAPLRSPAPPLDLDAVKEALCDSANEFELRFSRAFSDLHRQLHITPATAYHSFESVMDEVFRDGVNWGRVIGLFAFGGALAVECVDKEMQPLVERLVDWMSFYLDEHIQDWIDAQGGWARFAQIYGDDAAAQTRRSEERFKKWLFAGMTLVTGVVVGSLLAQRRL